MGTASGMSRTLAYYFRLTLFLLFTKLSFSFPGPRPGIPVHIMRNRVIEDGLIHLNKLGSDLRKRIIVHYVNAAGATESGLDAGGLFKEFWTDLSNQSLNPNWALFRETEDGFLYPNPSSRAAHGSESIILFEFLGRILGVCMHAFSTISFCGFY